MAISLKSTNTKSTTSDNTVFTATGILVVASGSDRFLVCGISSEDSTDADLQVSSVIIDPSGVNKSLTKSNSTSNGGGAWSNYAGLWYLKEADFPVNGTYDIVITFPAQVTEYGITANVYENVDATSPEANGSNALKSVTQVSASITTVSANAWVVDCCSSGDGTVSISPDSPQVSRNVTDVDSHWHGMSDVPIVTAGATSSDWTAVSNENRFVLANLALKPKTTSNLNVSVLTKSLATTTYSANINKAKNIDVLTKSLATTTYLANINKAKNVNVLTKSLATTTYLANINKAKNIVVLTKPLTTTTYLANISVSVNLNVNVFTKALNITTYLTNINKSKNIGALTKSLATTSYSANVSFSTDLNVNVFTKALNITSYLTNINKSKNIGALTKSLTTTSYSALIRKGSAIVPYYRILVIQANNRTFSIVNENRNIIIQKENRKFGVQ